MDERSIWKKEISFGRKPKAEQEIEPEAESKPSRADGGEPTSIWKKELSFGRKKQKPDTEVAPVADAQAADGEPAPKQSVWRKEISFGRKPKRDVEPESSDEQAPVDEPPAPSVPEEPVPTAEVDPEPAAEPAAAAVADEDLPVSDAEPAPDEQVWKKEVSFSRKPASDEVTEPVVDEPGSAPDDPAVARRAELLESWSRTPDVPEVAAAEPVAEDAPTGPVAVPEPEPKAEEPLPAEVVAEDPAAEERAALLESWSRTPTVPTTPPVEEAPTAEIPPSAAEPAAVVHPPVPAAELPPLPTEKVPFWKKDISFGGGKKKPAKQPKQPKEPKAKKPKAPKVKADRDGGGKGAKRLVGLKVGASQLAAARVSNNGSAELLQVAREPLDPGIVVGGELRDPDALAAALKDFFEKHKLPKRGVRLGIANNRIGVRTFEISGIDDPKQLSNAIRFRAQEALPIPIDEAVLDYQILGEGVDDEGKTTRKILLVVAYRELVDRYVDACRKAGVTLAGIDLEAFALLRALQAPQAGAGDDPSAALVAVAIGHERSTFAVSDGRICEFTRVLEWGGSALNVAIARALNAAPSEVEEVKRSLSLASSVVPEGLTPENAAKAVDAVRKAIQTFARELVSSLQYYQNQPGSLGIGEIVLSGGTAHLPGLAAELEALIGVRVRVGDPLARMKVSKKVGEPEQLGSLTVAIGLGIED